MMVLLTHTTPLASDLIATDSGAAAKGTVREKPASLLMMKTA